jgi:uracil-DNA glycosylase family 4
MGPCEQTLRNECAAHSLKYINPRGNPRSRVWCIGEAPGYDEEQQGFAFVGASGKELDRMLVEAGFTLADIYYTNPYKVRPPDNELEVLHTLGIPLQLYLDQFWEELLEYKPTIIISLGVTPTGILCPGTASRRDGETKITQWRGSLLCCDQLTQQNAPHYVVPVQHPAAILREWPERVVAVLCLAKAREEFDYWKLHGQLQPLPTRDLIIKPSIYDLKDFLNEILDKNLPVSNDIETIVGKYPYTNATATSPHLAMSFSFWDYDGDELVQLWRLYNEVLRNNRQIGQNYIGFDCPQYEALGFEPNVDLVDDTMVRHHTLWPEFEHKLQFLGMQYTRQPFWKDEGKLWSPKESKDRLMRYNALDAACTFEVFEKQEEDFDDRPHLRSFYTDYAIRRARAFHRIESRGILVDKTKLSALRDWVLREIDKNCKEAENAIGRPVVAAKCSNPRHSKSCKCQVKSAAGSLWTTDDVLNLASPKQLITEFARLKIKIPAKRGRKTPSVDEIALRKIIIAQPSQPLPLLILNVRELNKMKGTNIDAKLLNNTLYCSYVPTATLTGRSGSRINSLGYGTNLQNITKHSELGLRYRECLIARPGTVLVSCDQKGAEDWIVQGIIADVSGHRRGLDELLAGINRHRKLAAFLFSKPEAMIDKAGMDYFLAKKTRHAANYSMQAETMTDALLKEGMNIPKQVCEWLLLKFHEREPEIRGVFHRYIQEKLKSERKLITPFGRERIFFGLRPFSNNEDIFRQGYAQIPQSTVADNTGMAMLYLEDNGFKVIAENHDALTLEVLDSDGEVVKAVNALDKAFNRIVRFENGLEVRIEVEIEVGYDLSRTVTIGDHRVDRSILDALHKARSQRLSYMATS